MPKQLLRIVFEDHDLIVVSKPPGLLTATGPRERRPTLLAAVEAHVAAIDRRARIGLIHRLDRDATGLLVFSKNDRTYRSLKAQFFQHTVEREYAAIVTGIPTPPKGTIKSWLCERADGTVYSINHPGDGQIAVTDYELVRSRSGRSLMRVMLHTGRKHQIRVHFAQRGMPVVGDTVYRAPPGMRTSKPAAAGESAATTKAPHARRDISPPSAGPLRLAAVRLVLDHPRTGKRMTFQIDPPQWLRFK